MTAPDRTSPQPEVRAAIVDYGLGNLFSVSHACRASGITPIITSSPSEIEAADLVILPGVGAFADAMSCLRRLDLVVPLKDRAASGKPFVGICLGLQLLFSESEEFGVTRGLDIIPGVVRRLASPVDASGKTLKVPHVGWNEAYPPGGRDDRWTGTPLGHLAGRAAMYFVHSFHVIPERQDAVLSNTLYGDQEFCSAVHVDAIVACQFHPERSGEAGLGFYRMLRASIASPLEHSP